MEILDYLAVLLVTVTFLSLVLSASASWHLLNMGSDIGRQFDRQFGPFKYVTSADSRNMSPAEKDYSWWRSMAAVGSLASIVASLGSIGVFLIQYPSATLLILGALLLCGIALLAILHRMRVLITLGRWIVALFP